MPDLKELQSTATEADDKAKAAVKAFDGLRASGSAEDIVKAAQAVTTSKKATERAAFEVNTFELVGIYEGIKAQVLDGTKRWDFKTLLGKDITNVRIDVPFGVDGIALDQVSVNTLGKRVAVRATGTGGGTRSRKEMFNESNGESMTPRDYLAAREDVLGDITAKVLAEPSRYGLVDYAARCAAKEDAGWVVRDKPA